MTVKKLPFIFSAPHCSNRIPGELRESITLSDEEIEESTDIGTREIFGTLPAIEVLCAAWSRLVVDLNRSADQRDRKGVVAHVDYSGRNIYRPESLPGHEEVERRIGLYYEPYHRQLRRALEHKEIAGLIDCHSLFGIGPPDAPDPGEKRKDLVLSNNGDPQGCERIGVGPTTCQAEWLRLAKAAFEESGFSVSLNRPYAGGYITRHYGHSLDQEGKMGFQVEINQDLYCATGTTTPLPDKMEEVRERIILGFLRLAERMRKC